MRQVALIGLGAALMSAAIGCTTNGGNSGASASHASATSDADTDYCSCAYKHKHLDPDLKFGNFMIQGPFSTKTLAMWCPVNEPDNDARIAKLLKSKGVVLFYPFPPFGKSGLESINVMFPEQEDCSMRLLSETASRGEIKVVFESIESVAKRADINQKGGFFYLAPPGVYGTSTTKP